MRCAACDLVSELRNVVPERSRKKERICNVDAATDTATATQGHGKVLSVLVRSSFMARSGALAV